MGAYKKKIITLLVCISACSALVGLAACNNQASVKEKNSVFSNNKAAFHANKAEANTAISTVSDADSAEGIHYYFVEIVDDAGEPLSRYYVVNNVGDWSGSDLQIPTKYKGYPVREIHSGAFKNCKNLKSIVIPDTVTKIGEAAFDGCYNLEKVTLPTSLETLGKEAFANCLSLKEISIPDKVEELGDNTFYKCCNLESVKLSKALKVIGENAFLRCMKLEEISIPDNVIEIKDSAFYYCESLTTVKMPKSLLRIGKKAFNGCVELTSVDLPEAVKSVDRYSFAHCASLKKVSISKNVAFIGEYAFSACKSLTEISVTTSNESYKSVDGNLYTKDGKTLVQYAIGKSESKFTVPGTVERVYNSAFCTDTSLTSIEFEDGVRMIDENAFYGCVNLAEVKLSATMERIDKYAFTDCVAIQTIIIPKAMMTIESFAFRFTELTSIYFEGSIVDWKKNIRFGAQTGLEKVNCYFFSEEQPEEVGAWWHYEDGKPTVWTAEDAEEETETDTALA